LGQRKLVRVVDSAGRSAHILLPRVTAAFSSAACFFLSAESAANFSTRRSDVAVYDAAVRSKRPDPLEHVLKIFGEQSGGEALRNTVIHFDRLVKCLELENIDDWAEQLMLHNLSVVGYRDNCWLNVVSRPR